MNETYHIPANFTDAGRVMGMFELRNLVEAVILVLPVLYFCLVLLPLELTAKITVTLIIVVPLGAPGSSAFGTTASPAGSPPGGAGGTSAVL